MRRFAAASNENALIRCETALSAAPGYSGKIIVEVRRREYVNRVADVPDG